MVDHGMLFRADMVNAFLDQRKFQTRRVMTRMNTNIDGHGRCSEGFWKELNLQNAIVDLGPSPAGNPGPYLKAYSDMLLASYRIYPIYFVGDKVWVRETWREADYLVDGHERDAPYYIQYKADGTVMSLAGVEPECVLQDLGRYGRDWSTDKKFGTWKSPIHMFKKYARIWLEIIEVRIQHVQEISQVNAIDEGVHVLPEEWVWKNFPEYSMAYKEWRENGDYSVAPPLGISPKQRFEKLWDEINAKRGYPWEKNDWVIALTLKPIDLRKIYE